MNDIWPKSLKRAVEALEKEFPMTANEPGGLVDHGPPGPDSDHPHIPSWSVRIPAAIAKAEEHFAAGAEVLNSHAELCTRDCWTGLTANQVALAKALWGASGCPICLKKQLVTHFHSGDSSPHPALIAFTEKVESL